MDAASNLEEDAAPTPAAVAGTAAAAEVQQVHEIAPASATSGLHAHVVLNPMAAGIHAPTAAAATPAQAPAAAAMAHAPPPAAPAAPAEPAPQADGASEAALRAQLATAHAQLEMLRAELTQLHHKAAETSAGAMLATSAASSAKVKLLELQQQLDLETARGHHVAERIKLLHTQLLDRTTEVAQLNARIKDEKEREASLKAKQTERMEIMDLEVEQLKEQLATKVDELTRTKKALADSASQAEKTFDIYKKAEAARDAAVARAAKAERERDMANGKVGEWKSRHDAKCQEGERERRQWQLEKGRLHAVYDEEKRRMEADHAAALRTKSDIMERLQVQLDAATSRANELSISLRMAQGDMSEYQARAEGYRRSLEERDMTIAGMMQANFAAGRSTGSTASFWTRQDFTNNVKSFTAYLDEALEGDTRTEYGLYDAFSTPVPSGVDAHARLATALHQLLQACAAAATEMIKDRESAALTAIVCTGRSASAAVSDADVEHARHLIHATNSFDVFFRTSCELLFSLPVMAWQQRAASILDSWYTAMLVDGLIDEASLRTLQQDAFASRRTLDVSRLALQLRAWSIITNSDIEVMPPAAEHTIEYMSARFKVWDNSSARTPEGTPVIPIGLLPKPRSRLAAGTRGAEAADAARQVEVFGEFGHSKFLALSAKAPPLRAPSAPSTKAPVPVPAPAHSPLADPLVKPAAAVVQQFVPVLTAVQQHAKSPAPAPVVPANQAQFAEPATTAPQAMQSLDVTWSQAKPNVPLRADAAAFVPAASSAAGVPATHDVDINESSWQQVSPSEARNGEASDCTHAFGDQTHAPLTVHPSGPDHTSLPAVRTVTTSMIPTSHPVAAPTVQLPSTLTAAAPAAPPATHNDSIVVPVALVAIAAGVPGTALSSTAGDTQLAVSSSSTLGAAAQAATSGGSAHEGVNSTAATAPPTVTSHEAGTPSPPEALPSCPQTLALSTTVD